MRSLRPLFIALLGLVLLCSGNLLANETVPVQVVLTGVEGPLHATLLNDISLSHIHNDRYPAQTDFLFRRGQQELLDALRAHGYYQAEVEAALERQPGQTVARFTIDSGEAVRVTAIHLAIRGAGADELVWRQYRQFEMPLKIGQALVHGHYETTLSNLMNIAVNHGYLDARFVQRTFMVNPYALSAEIHIELDTGEPYLFGEISFIGSQRMGEDFLQRFLEFTPGDHYNNATLAELQKTLISSRYFSMVRYEPQFDAQNERRIPVRIHVEDNLPHRYRLGFGAGSDTGARLLFGFENRVLNDEGHRYEFDSVIGQRIQSLQFNYSIPGSRPSRQQWNLRTGWEASQSDSLDRQRSVLMPEYSHLTDNNWLLTPYVSLERERYHYRDQAIQTSDLLLGGIHLQKRVLNHNAYPGKGYRHNIALRLSQRNPISDSDFTQLELASKGVISPLDNWRLLARARVATTWADDQEELPASYRYLLGGETLRGFAYESIGIVDEEGRISGARHMALASLETDYRLSRWFGLGAFSDAGQVFQPGVETELKIGSGIGLRGYTPVGIVRLDFAWAVSETERPWRLHLSLGMDL